MALALRLAPEGMTAASYVNASNGLKRPEPVLPQADYHVCFGDNENLRVSDIWGLN